MECYNYVIQLQFSVYAQIFVEHSAFSTDGNPEAQIGFRALWKSG